MGKLLLALVIVCSSVSVPLTHATSLADNNIHVVDNIQLGGAGDSCAQQIRTTNWLDPSLWRSTWNYQNNYDNAHADTEAFISELNTNMQAGSGWAVMQRPNPNNGNLNMITVQTFSPNATVTIPNSVGSRPVASGTVRSLDIFYNPGVGCRLQSYNSGAQNVSSYGNSIPGEYGYFLVAANNIVYPNGYEGELLPSLADVDGDGLNQALERTQGTSDVSNSKDTDKDGLDDLKESRWFNDRDDIFCGSTECAYPDPLKKDLYVEIDWMNDGARGYKPTLSQINRVINAFAGQNILAHFDMGQFGGGNVLPSLNKELFFAPTENELDFYDLKNGTPNEDPEFSPARKNTWHYMITGVDYANYLDSNTELAVAGSTGSSYAGDDDSIISIEKVEALNPFNILNPTSQDVAIAGTILHELGHNLCLSDEDYPDQPSECLYQGIDNTSGDENINNADGYYNLEDYESTMNYRYQFSKVDYSHGANGSPYDHNDWAGISLGMGDFVNSNREWYYAQNQQRGSTPNLNQPSREDMINAIQS